MLLMVTETNVSVSRGNKLESCCIGAHLRITISGNQRPCRLPPSKTVRENSTTRTRTRREASGAGSLGGSMKSPLSRCRLRTVTFAPMASSALVLTHCYCAEAAKAEGRLESSLMAQGRAKSAAARACFSNYRGHNTNRRYRIPTSLRLRALPAPFAGTGPASALSLLPSLPVGDILAYPDLAAGTDLESLPLWASFLGLVAANIAGLSLTLAVLRYLQDASEPLTVVKVQVAMLERRPQLQSKLAELSSMIQMGRAGAWVIVEQAILQLLQHQSTIAYAGVSHEQLSSKKRAYTVFGEIAESEAAKAKREEAVVRHIGETTDDESEDARKTAAGGKDFLGGLMGGLGLGPSGPPAKELTVVTLVIAARGKLVFKNKVTDWGALRQALEQLTGLTSDQIMAVELLWTPRDNSDYLTRQQLERDYPDLVVLGPQGKAPLGART